MALKGTLKDFGIADILQLIGQQQKNGVLTLKSKDQEVNVAFKDGNIVKAESSTRKKKDLIGSMLVRAEVISETQLTAALDVQKRTLKRLGDVLVANRMLTAERFKQMIQLQATETLYKLFMWKSGTYEFDQREVELDQDAMAPMRAESVLMEGFRMVDEWPHIKKRIPRYDMTFTRTAKELPPPQVAADAFDAALDDAFAEKKPDEKKGDFATLSDNERKVHALIAPSRDVRKLVDLSCIGEFETCKALTNLLNLEYLEAHFPEGKAPSEGPGFFARATAIAARVVVSIAVLACLGFLGWKVNLDAFGLTSAPATTYADPAAQRYISRAQLSRLEAALDVYRIEKGELPEKLDALVDAGILELDDLTYPWRDRYYYRRVAGREFILLPPLR